MIQDETVKKLMAISTPRTFKAAEYVCHEGQPGEEMYIILRGSVGVYVTSALGEPVEVSRIMSGDFFGEMAVFDNLPRSASCIALEDVIAVAIDKKLLPMFFKNCPEMTLKLVENMSGRIRRLNNALYKTEQFVQNKKLPEFKIPAEYSFSHNVEEPYHDLMYTEPVTADCPVCGKKITVLNLKKNIMSRRKERLNGRIAYKECDPLWYDVWACPYCHYSNHYLSFFKMMPFKRELIKRILREQHEPVLEQHHDLKTPFDQLVIRFLEAIHINEAVNASDDLLIGRLWLGLYWLFDEVEDDAMKKYAAKNSAPKLEKALKSNAVTDDYAKRRYQLTTAILYSEIDDKKSALKLCNAALETDNGDLKKFALEFKNGLV